MMEKNRKHLLSRQDTPEKLSARYGLPVCMLYRANRGRPWRPGQTIWIPPLCWCACQRKSASGGTPKQLYHDEPYLVQKEDRLFTIAQKFGTSMERILKRNGLSHPREIREGMQLQIPCLHDDFMIYSYRMADTPEQVAEKFAMRMEELTELNGAQRGMYPGMQLVVRKRRDK